MNNQSKSMRLLNLLHSSFLLFSFNNAISALSFTHDGWRIAMNIGREPGTGMPSEWGASGCRLPVVVQCDFKVDNKNKKKVVLLDDKVRFTGPAGEVICPVKGGDWSLSNEKDLAFTLEFPKEVVRRDVTLQGTVRCEGLLYSKDTLKSLNEQFCSARKEKWVAEEIVEDLIRKKEAPKKWNPITDEWEKQNEEEPLFSQLSKRASFAFADRKEQKANSARPDLKNLSADFGPFPGVETEVHFQKEGKVTLKKGFSKVVVGTWYAEPINDKPISYYGNFIY